MSELNPAEQPLGAGVLRPCIDELAVNSICDWAKNHYRYRVFEKEERIPTRSRLLYIVQQGVVRVMGESIYPHPQKNYFSAYGHSHSRPSQMLDETFLDIVTTRQIFEVSRHQHCHLQCIAQIDNTCVAWLYWADLANWPGLEAAVLQLFRLRQQRLVLRLNAMGHRRTSDRLLMFLQLLIEDHGYTQTEGAFLPFSLTHTQIASAIGATRVTVTRALGKLRKHGEIIISPAGFLGIPHHKIYASVEPALGNNLS